jgi:hypothetical protein
VSATYPPDYCGRYGRWAVLSGPVTRSVNGALVAFWRCVCDCGTSRDVRAHDIRSGKSRSCGCLNREASVAANSRHGSSPRAGSTPEYRVWLSMIQRCTNPARRCYPSYGGRGIAVCERWRDFANFLADVGPRPAGKSLDRIDNDGHYEPGNVRWVTQREQCANKRTNKNFTINGVTKNQSEWCREFGVAIGTFRGRMRRGQSPLVALGGATL